MKRMNAAQGPVITTRHGKRCETKKKRKKKKEKKGKETTGAAVFFFFALPRTVEAKKQINLPLSITSRPSQHTVLLLSLSLSLLFSHSSLFLPWWMLVRLPREPRRAA